MTKTTERPGHLARRFQQIAVAIFHAEVAEAGFDLTPVQFAALEMLGLNPGIDQITLAGLIAYDRTTITGVVDRLAQKALIVRQPKKTDRRARELRPTEAGRNLLACIEPAVDRAQEVLLRGLTSDERREFLRLMHKTIDAANDLSRAPLRPTMPPSGT